MSLELSGTPINTLYIRPGGFLSNYFEFSHANSRINDFEFPSKEDIKDPEYFVSKIFKAIETKKSEVNCGTLRDRIGYQLNYWAPAILHKVINYSNRNLINKIISNR
ncbi:MAG: hypothetical protein GY870_17505 [archaeon]|nr:hypothetical protein [archaeon]